VSKRNRRILRHLEDRLDVLEGNTPREEKLREIRDYPPDDWWRDHFLGKQLIEPVGMWTSYPQWKAMQEHIKRRHAEGERDGDKVWFEAWDTFIEVDRAQPENLKWCLIFEYKTEEERRRKAEFDRKEFERVLNGEADDFVKAWREGFESAWRAPARPVTWTRGVGCPYPFGEGIAGCWQDNWGICDHCGTVSGTAAEQGWTVDTGRGKSKEET
jgi:hypothetical protein